MDVGINNVIYMELHSGPKMANGTCGKTIVVGAIDRGSTVQLHIGSECELQVGILLNPTMQCNSTVIPAAT